MPFEQDVEIAVVGAGITGLAMALALARADAGTGAEVALLAAAPLPTSRAEAADGRTAALLMPAIGLLTRLGVFDPTGLGAEPLYRLRIVGGSGKGAAEGTALTFDAAELGMEAFGWNIPNATLAARLAAAVGRTAGIAVHAGAPLQNVTEAGDRLLLEAGDTRLAARLVIGADGRDSVVRETAGITTTQRDHGQTAIVCRFAHTKPHRNISTELHRQGGPFTMVPLPGRNSSLVWVDRTAESEARLDLDDDAFREAMAPLAEPWLGPIGALSRRHAYPIRARLAKALTAPRRALVGEAAHVMSPLGAQGLNLSLRDVATLAGLLAAHPGDPGDPALLAAYAEARAVDIKARFWGIDTLNHMVMQSLPPFRLASSLALGLLDRLPPARRALMQGMMEGVPDGL
ncbi:MAG: FAD-dependent oxidoreductase [Geminicoccaceae bacterium]